LLSALINHPKNTVDRAKIAGNLILLLFAVFVLLPTNRNSYLPWLGTELVVGVSLLKWLELL